jgi:succinate dehydrogenase / fumarate reductase iron-sulfur subunit
VKDTLGIGLCNITKCCSEVCPEQIHITDNGIIPLKERVADDYFDPIRWIASKVSGEEKKPKARLPVIKATDPRASAEPPAKDPT